MNQLQTDDGKTLLDIIDRLRSHGLDRLISLPQIIVVGDQSSGKSSVLEAISGIRFPVNDGTCTRFATEVILRKGTVERGSVRISPSDDCSDERRKKLLAFGRDDLQLNVVPDIIAEAIEVLEVSTESHGFTKDVLVLELSGPTQDHLTLVDLPGLIQVTVPGQNPDEIGLVKGLVQQYASRDRSIILAVVSAKHDVNNQAILEVIKGIKSWEQRTLGVITFPDKLLDRPNTAASFLAVARNEVWSLKHGWHVLRNPGFVERQDPKFQRDAEELLFFENTPPWCELAEENRDVAQLRLRLGKLLLAHIRGELKPIIATIDSRIDDCNKILSRLGPSRRTPKDQRAYLSDIGSRYQRLVNEALVGTYSNVEFIKSQDKRLRAQIRLANEAFARRMAGMGHSWEIIPDNAFGPPPSNPSQEYTRAIGAPFPRVPKTGAAVSIGRSQYVEKVLNHLERSRGLELPGSFDPLLVGDLFRDQSVRWEQLARTHAQRILNQVQVFLESAARHVAGQARAEILIQQKIDPAMIEKGVAIDAKITELLRPFNACHPIVLNPQYARAQLERREMQRKLDPLTVTSARQVDLQACSQLVDDSQCYYEIALAVFVHNIATLAIECCLLDGLDQMITEGTIIRMSDEEVHRLAGESNEDTAVRARANTKLDILVAGRKELQNSAIRQALEDENASYPLTVESAPIMFATPVSNASLFTGSTATYASPHTSFPLTQLTSSPVVASGPELRVSGLFPTGFVSGSPQPSPRNGSDVRRVDTGELVNSMANVSFGNTWRLPRTDTLESEL